MNPELVRKISSYNIDYNLVRKEVLAILEEHNFIPQIGLTHTVNVLPEDRIRESTGSIYDYQTNTFRFRETDFCIFNEAYKTTYLFQLYQSIPNLGRYRIMTLDGPKCYSIHKDMTQRYHIPIETNLNCLFLFPDTAQQYHMPADNLYLVDTRHRHTFVNGSKERRIHLVMDDLSTLK